MAREIELLAPAANAETAIQAILHGADAVYIGPSAHGARKAASNSLEDIKRVVDFAHPYGAKVYATMNTILYDHELQGAENLAWELYRAGVDALIVQDMALLRLDLPPIALHASTQCDTRTLEKAKFLEDVGFSQIVLARELTLREISEICSAVSVPVECFIHGALCVSYSGRCHASQATTGRSANRGECSQVCRLPFTMKDASGRILAQNRHLLSLKDFNASDLLDEMLEAGVSSLKIEGRLKDISYVKNVVAYYRARLDAIIAANPEKYRRSSYGCSVIDFKPQLDKSFNRGFTHYFLDSRRPASISSPLTPKSMGEVITDASQLNNGDGISFFNNRDEYEGVMVNGVEGRRIIGNRAFHIPKGHSIHRTLDAQWQKMLARPTASRRIWLDVTMYADRVEAEDERGVKVCLPTGIEFQPARTPRPLRDIFDKFGNTIYQLRDFKTESLEGMFAPASQLADLRRRLIDTLDSAARATYYFDKRRPENPACPYPADTLDYQDNVANELARKFYHSHGVAEISMAMEREASAKSSAEMRKKNNGMRSVMTTRHCILREMGKCLKFTSAAERDFKLPLTLTSGKSVFRLDFDCKRCEMHLLTDC